MLALLAAAALAQSGSRTDAIVGGDVDETTRAVFQIYTATEDGGATFCSSVLISPRILLTAAHCFDGEDGGQRFPYAITGETRGAGATYVSPLALLISPYRDALAIGYHDLAMVLLHEPAAGVKPLERVSVPRQDWKSVHARVVGYGLTAATQNDGDVRRSVAVPIARVEPGFVIAGAGAKGSCFGDSGGPLLITGRDGRERVLGITSGSTSPDCDTTSAFTRPSSDNEWIRQVTGGFETEALAASCGQDDRCRYACGRFDNCRADACATPDPDCTQTGKACESSERCAGGVCRVAANGEGVCSKRCEAAADCPNQVACTAGVCTVEPAACGCDQSGGAFALGVLAFLIRPAARAFGRGARASPRRS